MKKALTWHEESIDLATKTSIFLLFFNLFPLPLQLKTI